jgi:DNA-directed RNA polymerase specialized sigma24 family protein
VENDQAALCDLVEIFAKDVVPKVVSKLRLRVDRDDAVQIGRDVAAEAILHTWNPGAGRALRSWIWLCVESRLRDLGRSERRHQKGPIELPADSGFEPEAFEGLNSEQRERFERDREACSNLVSAEEGAMQAEVCRHHAVAVGDNRNVAERRRLGSLLRQRVANTLWRLIQAGAVTWFYYGPHGRFEYWPDRSDSWSVPVSFIHDACRHYVREALNTARECVFDRVQTDRSAR